MGAQIMLSESLISELRTLAKDSGRGDLVARLDAARRGTKEVLTSKEAATLLGVSSVNTVKNWLESGLFPGAKKTPGGHWRFLRSEVEAAKEKMAELARRNDADDLMAPDVDDDSDVPLL